MIPLLTIIISTYVIVRMVELVANEDARGEKARGGLRWLAVIAILITLGSCAGVQLSGATLPTP